MKGAAPSAMSADIVSALETEDVKGINERGSPEGAAPFLISDNSGNHCEIRYDINRPCQIDSIS